MGRKIVSLALAGASFALAGCQTSATAIATAPPLLIAQAKPSFFPADEELKLLLANLVARGDAKAIVLGLIEPDGRRRIVAYGDPGEGAKPLGPKSVFEIGSISKTFTGIILADMVRRGEVALDDPIAKHLPAGLKVPSRGDRQITLLDLATHSSSLPRLPTGYKIPDRSNPYAHYQADHLHAFLARYELEQDIGTKPLYSNLGMGLLGHLLSRAAGTKDFPELVRQRITGPLGLTMTDYGRAGEMSAWMVKGHDAKGAPVPYWDVAVLAGAGGINANAEDMLDYLAANAAPPTTPLQAAMHDAHQPRRKINDKGLSIGLAWQRRTRNGLTAVEHGGGTAGFGTHLAFDPVSGAGVVVLANSDSFSAGDEIAFELLRGRSLQPVPAAGLDDHVGTYQLRPDLKLVVTIEDGRLYAQPTGGPRALLHAQAGGFFMLSADAELDFVRDAAGAVSAVTLTRVGSAMTGAKIG